MADRVQLSQLARELDVFPPVIVEKCWGEGLIPVPKRPRSVSFGLAETIREWHRSGQLGSRTAEEERVRRAAEKKERFWRGLHEAAGRANSFVWGFGAEFEAVAGYLEHCGIDAGSLRGRRIMRWALRDLPERGDLERWVTCWGCKSSFMPVLNDAFANAFVDYLKDDKQSKVWHCLDCGGMAYHQRKPMPPKSP